MNPSRRSFLLGAAAVTAVMASPAILKALDAAALPILHGDGIHDDAPALQSLMNGGWAQSPAGEIFKKPRLRGGTYLIKTTLKVSGRDQVFIEDATIISDHSNPMFRLEEPGRLDLTNVDIKLLGEPPGGIASLIYTERFCRLKGAA